MFKKNREKIKSYTTKKYSELFAYDGGGAAADETFRYLVEYRIVE